MRSRVFLGAELALMADDEGPCKLMLAAVPCPDTQLLLQVGSKRSRGSQGTEPAQALMTDEEGKPRKKLRTTVPACQFLTVYNHRHTLKQR